MDNLALVKLLALTCVGFGLALAIEPFLFFILTKFKLGKHIRDDGSTPIFTKLHEVKKNTPTMGGILVWGTLSIIAGSILFLKDSLGGDGLQWLNIITRKETLLPWGAFVGASLVGGIDDILDIKRLGHNGQGLRFRVKFFLYLATALIGAWWFYFKIEYSSVYIPFFGDLNIGFWYFVFFILVCLGLSFSVNQTDGLDGLAGGTLLISLLSYTLIAYMQGKENLAAFLGIICGALLAFLWFNIYPAKFFMGDTGSMGLGILLAIVAFLTQTESILPLIGVVFVIEFITTLLQLFYKRFLGRKLFLISPIHHHLEAKGMPESQITMRFWIIQAVGAIAGLIIYFVGYHV